MQINLLLHPAFPIFVEDRIRFSQLLLPLAIFDIVLDRMHLGKPGPSSRFLSVFTIFVYVETNRQML